MTVEAILQPISFCRFAISAPRERTFITSARGLLLISVALVVVLHLAGLFAWMALPPSEPVPPREMEVTVAMAIPPEAQPETPPVPPPPKHVPQPRKAAPAPEPLPAQAEAQPSETPVEQPSAPAQVAAPVQVAAAPAPAALSPVVAPPPPQPVQPDVEPDYKASYLNNPRPPYPPAARRMGLQGRVMLNVEVLAEGSCGQANVAQSSGHEMLDKAALQAVKTWKFSPARQAGRAITKWCQVPINFTLKEDEA